MSSLRELLVATERRAIEETLKKELGTGRLSRAAKRLGISRKCLWEKMKRHGIDKREHQPQTSLPLQGEKAAA